jgi:PKD domain
MEKIISRKILAIGLLFLFLGASATIGVSTSDTSGQRETTLVNNILVSTNAAYNYGNVRIGTRANGDTWMVFEQEKSLLEKTVPVVFSTNKGQTWTQYYEIDSVVEIGGSGMIINPHIVYNAPRDLFWVSMVDPNADSYNNIIGFIHTNGSAPIINGISGSSSSGYYWCAATCTKDYFMSFTSEDYSPYEQIFGLGYWTYPDFGTPPGIGGYYYDGQSLFISSPISYLNGAMNDLRDFCVYETDQGKHSFIGIKSGTTDQALIESGEQQNAMDKYGDIEQMPAEWVTENAGGPDVAGSGNKVCVVYEAEDGNVKCSYSTCVGTYAPEFSWKVSTVEAGALAPSVWMAGDTVRCAYVKSGNLYYKTSNDAGATWGAAEQMNTVNGKVSSARGSTSVGKGGIAFVDTRGGTPQIYFAPITPLEPETPTIAGPASGDAKTAYEYTFTAVDGQGDQVTYTIDWGDGSAQETAGPAASGAPVKVSHTFAAAGDYTIKAKATDTGGHASDWGTLPVTMPYVIQTPFRLLMEKLFERFPHAFPILRHLLG